MTTFAEAFVRLRIDKGALKRDATTALRGPEARQAGTKMGQEFTVGAKASVSKGGRDIRAALIGVAGAFAPVTGAAAAAGVGIAAFGVLAVPSLLRVTKALSDPGGTSAAWGELNAQERRAATGAQQFAQRYQAMAQSVEPRVFQVFFQALGLGSQLMAPLPGLFAQGALGVSDFLATFTQDSGLRQFITFSTGNARPAIDALTGALVPATHAILTLLQSFEGPGIIELRALGSVFTALDHGITFLSQHAPGLTGVALGIGGVALALGKLGILGPALRLTGLANISTQLKGFVGATKGATIAEKALLAQTTAMEAITPWGWVAIGITLIGGLVFALSKLGNGTEGTVKRIEEQTKAQGFNTSGYFAAADAVGKLEQQEAARNQQIAKGTQGSRLAAGATAAMRVQTDALTESQKKFLAEGRNQNAFLTTLQGKYGLTRQAAVSLALHSGVLATQVNKGGSAMKAALTQAEAYANANRSAQGPTTQLSKDMHDFANRTLDAKERLTSLTNALNIYFNPAVAADQAAIQLKNDQVTLARALRASGGETGKLTQKQRDARDAFNNYITQVASAASSAFQATGRTSSYTRVINAALPFLERAAGHNKALRHEIQLLIDTERRMRSEQVNITVSAHGSWAVVGGGHRVLRGGGVPGQGGALHGLYMTTGTRGVDDQLIRVQKGELMVPPDIVDSGAVDHLRGLIPGFLRGGVAGSYSSGSVPFGLPGLDKWMRSENDLTISAIADQTAAALHRAASAPAPGGGRVGWRPGAGVAQWQGVVESALAQLGLPDAYKLLVLYQMMTESGGNPNIVNTTDSNWVAGHPSVGLMQVIAGTFAANAGPYLSTGPFSWGVSVNPMANVYSALHYGANNGRGFGTGPGQIGSGHGYARGGWITEPMLGIGLRTGRVSTLGEHENELVTSGRGLDALAGLLGELIDAVHANADRTADGVAGALGAAARSGLMTTMYGAG